MGHILDGGKWLLLAVSPYAKLWELESGLPCVWDSSRAPLEANVSTLLRPYLYMISGGLGSGGRLVPLSGSRISFGLNISESDNVLEEDG